MPDNRLPKKGIVDSLIDINEKLKRIQRTLCCSGGGTGGLAFVSTLDSDTVTFTGDGTPGSPLAAEASMSGINTLYSGDDTISSNRVVTLASGIQLQFNSPVQSTFEINLQNATPSAAVLFRVRNGGGDGGVILQKGTIESLLMGQYGSKLRIGAVQLNNLLSTSVLGTDAQGNIIAGTVAPQTFTPNLAVAATDGTGTLVSGVSNVLAIPITGYTLGTNGSISATNTILEAFGRLQGQMGARVQVTTVLSAYVVGANTPIAATDTLIGMFGKAQGQINARAPIASPTFTGTPATVTPAVGTNTTQIASTAFVISELAARMKGGTATFNANGVLTSFTIPHGLTTVQFHHVTRNTDLNGNPFQSSISGANILVTFVEGPPINGTVVVVNWSAYGV